MNHGSNFSDVLAGSADAARQVEDVQLIDAKPDPGLRLVPNFDEARSMLERGPKAPFGLAAGTSKRASGAALGAGRPCPIRFAATPAAPSIAARGPGKPTVSALH